MFDCPDPSHTSPTKTSLMATLPMLISSGPAATSGFSHTVHFPFSAAFTVTLCPWKSTFTLSPGSAHPQMRTGIPCWSTIWSEINAGSLTAPCSAQATVSRPKSLPILCINTSVGNFRFYRARRPPAVWLKNAASRATIVCSACRFKGKVRNCRYAGGAYLVGVAFDSPRPWDAGHPQASCDITWRRHSCLPRPHSWDALASTPQPTPHPPGIVRPSGVTMDLDANRPPLVPSVRGGCALRADPQALHRASQRGPLHDRRSRRLGHRRVRRARHPHSPHRPPRQWRRPLHPRLRRHPRMLAQPHDLDDRLPPRHPPRRRLAAPRGFLRPQVARLAGWPAHLARGAQGARLHHGDVRQVAHGPRRSGAARFHRVGHRSRRQRHLPQSHLRAQRPPATHSGIQGGRPRRFRPRLPRPAEERP